MQTKNQGKPRKNSKTQAYSTPSLGPGPRPRPGPRPWGAVGLRFIFFRGFSFVFGMHVPLLGRKLILGWIQPNTRN